jgi:hypothetical protein
MWYGLLAVAALTAPIGGQAQAPKTTQPKIREIATIPGVDAREAVQLPNGRILLYAAGANIFAYDLASKRSTLVTSGFDGELAISRNGDRIAFDHYVEESKFAVIWSVPINPTTGTAAGPAQRISLGPGGTPSFSPDGKLIAFVSQHRPDGDVVAVAPATGGAQRELARYKDEGISWTSWSDDGRDVFFVVRQRTTQGYARSLERVPATGGPSEKLISFPGFVKAMIDGRIAFYYPERAAALEGRLAYRTASGASGEIGVPAFADNQGFITAKFATPRWLWAKSTKPSERSPSSTIYELDMSPVLQSLGIK